MSIRKYVEWSGKRYLGYVDFGGDIPGDQEGLFKLAIQLRKFFNWVIYN
jgi:hypothetical protein